MTAALMVGRWVDQAHTARWLDPVVPDDDEEDPEPVEANGAHSGELVNATTVPGTTGTTLMLEFTFADDGDGAQAITVACGGFDVTLARVLDGGGAWDLRISVTSLADLDVSLGPAGDGTPLGRYLCAISRRIGEDLFVDVWQQGTSAPIASRSTTVANQTFGGAAGAVTIAASSDDPDRSPWFKPWVRDTRPNDAAAAGMFIAGFGSYGDAWVDDTGRLLDPPDDFEGDWTAGDPAAQLGLPTWLGG